MFSTADEKYISQVTPVAEKSDLSSDARNLPEETEGSSQTNSRDLTLNMLIKELVFCIALALTAYGALHNRSPKISNHPNAVRFFSSESGVTDWYRGQLRSALLSLEKTDISFVMYYAPWDAESQYVKGEFEKAAMVLGDRVHFAAINCWYPGSECRNTHKLPSWPIMMVYTSSYKGIHYKGPKNAHTMVNFLEMIMTPLKRITSAEELITLVPYCDAVAIGFVPMSTSSKSYNIWYQTAVKIREYDVLGEICFVAVTSEALTAEFDVDTVPNARLILWDGGKEFFTSGSNVTWSEPDLVSWLVQNFSQPVARITPLWKKSFAFERHVSGRPVLMLFTPMNPLYMMLPNYALMQEVSMEYHNCKNNRTNRWTTELVKLHQTQRSIYQLKDHISICKENAFKKRSQPNLYSKTESRNNKYPWNNITEPQPKNTLNFFSKRGLGFVEDLSLEEPVFSFDWLHECNTKTFPAERSFYENYAQCKLFEQSFSLPDISLNADVETTMLPLENDPLSAENLIQHYIQHKCKLMKFAQEYSPPIFPAHNQDEAKHPYNLTRINGLGCSVNASLNFVVMDSVNNHHFAESLGVDIRSKKDMTAVVILDSENESQYILSEEYSAKSLRDFIYNFTYKKLKRSLRSHVDSTHTHHFASDGKNAQMGIDNATLHVVELTTKSFRKMVKTPGALTIVTVCAGACGALTSQAVVAAARLLRDCGVAARVARLDALRHDLPWHYSAHTYPTIFVFPRDRKREADSQTYPGRRRVSAGGVLALALRSLGAPLHLRVRLELCSRAQSTTEKRTCLKDIKEHITTVIDRNLRYYRRTEGRQIKDALFRRLQHLHRVSLELSLIQIPDLKEGSLKITTLVNSLHSLSKNWDIDESVIRNQRPS